MSEDVKMANFAQGIS